MARARNIKPGFFANEELVELPFATRLLFIGLWTLADREGRLEDRPKRIKMALFPADNLDIDHALNALAESKFLIRYEHGGERFIQVTSFSKHQNPHRDEKKSTIPEYIEHNTSTVQTLCKEDVSIVAIGLIPDPLPLIPDSLIDKPTTSDTVIPTSSAKNEKAGAVVILPHIALSIAFRKAGISAQPANPKLMALAEQGVSPETVAAACADALAAKPDAGFGYVLAILERWSKEAAEMKVSGATRPNARASPGYQTPNEKAKEWADKLTGKVKNEQRTPNFKDLNTLDGSVTDLARTD